MSKYIKTFEQFINSSDKKLFENIEDRHEELIDEFDNLPKAKKKKIEKEFNNLLDDFDEAYDEDNDDAMEEILSQMEDLL